MDKILSAKGARKIAKQNDVDTMLEEIMDKIAKRAENGEFSLQIRDYGFESYEEYNKPLNTKKQELVDKLHNLGYNTKGKYEDKAFGTDIYLEITW